LSGTRLAHSWILAAAFAVFAGGLILFVSAPYGPGASGDSVTYLSVAQSLADGEGWVRFDGRRYIAWPPLYPLTLTIGIGAGLEPAEAARLLGALSFAVTLAFLVLILARVTGSLVWAAVGGALALASPAVLETYATAWTEGPFTALTTLAFWLALRSEAAPRRRDLLVLGLVVGAAWLTRYVGVVLAAAFAGWLLLRPASTRERWQRLVLFGAAAALGPLTWMLRNFVETGTPAGDRGAAVTPLARNAEQFATSLATTLNLDALGGVRPVVAAVVVFGVAGLALVGAWRGRPPLSAAPTLPALFILLYAAAMVGLATWTPVTPLFALRFATPVWIPLVLLSCILAAEAWQRGGTAPARIALAAVLTGACAYGLAATAVRVGEHRERGVHSIGRAEWHRSALVDAVRSRHTGATLLTNNPHGVYFHTGLAVDYAPRRHGFRSEAASGETIEKLRARVAAEDRVPLAWFLSFGRGYGYYTPKELAAEGFCLLSRDPLADGIYFEITDPSQCPGPRVVPPDSRAPGAAR
jgi:MFS family permease